MEASFELDARIAAWRTEAARRGLGDAAVLDELESHLWEEIDVLMTQGFSAREAFLHACVKLGHEDLLAEEYRKATYWTAPERAWYDHLIWSLLMLRNYFKVATRTLYRQKMTSLINGIGLALGIAASLLILQFVHFEWSYDRFHTNSDDLYRLTNDRYQNGKLIQHGVITYPAVAKAMKQDYPEIINAVRLVQDSRNYVQRGDIGFEETNLLYADSAFLSMFTFPLIDGDPQTALNAPYSVLFSERQAEKYFGANWRSQNIIGASLTFDHETEMTLTGVFEEVPTNSHIRFNMLASYATLERLYGDDWENSWTFSEFMTYFQLAPGSNPAALETKFANFSERYFEGDKVTGSFEQFFLQPLLDIHLHSDYEYETWIHGNATVVWSLLLIAGVIMLIVWVNYINITTARSMERAKEVGIRKVLGAENPNLMRQFVLESALLNLAGAVMALPLVLIARPLFNQLPGITLANTSLLSTLGISFAVIFAVGILISGVYPALMLSSFKPVSVLKGQLVKSKRSIQARKGLIVFQFAISFILMAGMLTVYQQLQFMKQQDLGINIDQTVVIESPRLTRFDSTYFHNIDAFKQELTAIPGVEAATLGERRPGRRTGRVFDVERLSGPNDANYTMGRIAVDHAFFETFEMPLLAGRSFDETDYNMAFENLNTLILNASAAELIGFETPEAAISEQIRFWDNTWSIVGIVGDHHQESLKLKKEPIMYPPFRSTFHRIFVKVAPEYTEQALVDVEKAYASFYPGNPFNYTFLEEDYNAQYRGDQAFSTLASLFALLGVVLACLGLFGLSALTTYQRTKEIGVRKVLGASVSGLVGLLIKDFVKLIALATLIALPLTYLVLHNWLVGYAYHIELGLMLFVVPAALLLLFAIASVSVQTTRAALADPVVSLRYE